MATSRRLQFVYGQVASMLVILLALSLLDTLSLEKFFVGAFLAFLILLDFTDPINITSSWRKRLRWIVLLGILGFGYVFVRRVLSALSGVSF